MNTEELKNIKFEVEDTDTEMENEERILKGKRKNASARGRKPKFIFRYKNRLPENEANNDDFVPESGDAARTLLEAYRDDEKASMALAKQIMSNYERIAANEIKLIEERRTDINTLIQNLTKVIKNNADERREMKNKEAELYDSLRKSNQVREELHDSLRKSNQVRDELVIENSGLRAKVDELQKSVQDVFSAIKNNLSQSKE